MRLFKSFIIGSILMVQTLMAGNISSFLHDSKIEYLNNLGPSNVKTVHFVIGNESADLDSIISSIGYAYLLKRENPKELYVPLLNISRDQIKLRNDVLYLLKKSEISPEDLLFLDDQIPLDQLFDESHLRLNLVDHNVLRPSQIKFSSVVERVVDHHADEKAIYPMLKDKTVAVVGSTATLVTEKFTASPSVRINSDLALMLLGAILIDTRDLQAPEKTTDRDRAAVAYLKDKAEAPKQFYEKLLEAKNDVAGFSISMILSKDFKEYVDGKVHYGISSIPMSIYWKRKDVPQLLPELQKFAAERGLMYLILLMHNPDEGPKRTILVFSYNAKYMDAFQAYVENDKMLKKIFTPLKNPDDARVRLYGTDIYTSRKELQPLLKLSSSQEILNAYK